MGNAPTVTEMSGFSRQATDGPDSMRLLLPHPAEASEASAISDLAVIHDLPLDEVLGLDRSVLAESLLRVRQFLNSDASEHVSRFNAAL
ncbi:hypothetical protein Dvina_02520 [Dactylosporangium vinaceum]|uniref:FXSXX-COOH protein n=1 Tax=Dactylosporangium vinaceum TaxID=53362 RepID=A0ABV5MFE5_9ACTN|nr:hypothetical protein [Dactylosporangium vinaceum]UAB97102.1 hypothetical protein Dvina_02520 [Dactylosporangium vinaceum]